MPKDYVYSPNSGICTACTSSRLWRENNGQVTSFKVSDLLDDNFYSIDRLDHKNASEIDLGIVCPFNVVDGQYRVDGLKMAAEKDSRVLDFEVPVNIAIEISPDDSSVLYK
jgi:hypothetical protein